LHHRKSDGAGADYHRVMSREVSPLLGSRSGLSTAEDSTADIAAKIAELVDV
jgi:hypothetical protein